jgi:Asp-tRNA(Asn)/Glu-tRNA(Gln) amidotransferase A subunit family amidase
LEEKTPYDPLKFLPPLFGIPASFKDNIELEGTVSTIGLRARANRVAKQDSWLAQVLKRAGIIPFVKTNLPQLALDFDSNNEVWGRALNPWNRNKSVGGSSGGEAAAVAARISPLGVANDMGGSLRIPSAFCGVSCLMSGQNRLPNIGTVTYFLLYADTTAMDSREWI